MKIKKRKKDETKKKKNKMSYSYNQIDIARLISVIRPVTTVDYSTTSTYNASFNNPTLLCINMLPESGYNLILPAVATSQGMTFLIMAIPADQIQL